MPFRQGLVAATVLACLIGTSGVRSGGSGRDGDAPDSAFYAPRGWPGRSEPTAYVGATLGVENYSPGDSLLFVFAVIADSHFRVYGFPDYLHLKAMDVGSEILACCVADINAHWPPVDFAVHLGDLTDIGQGRDFDSAGVILSDLDCPLYPVVGNHDNFESDNKQGWKRFSGRDSTDYGFDFLGVHFVVIDCTLNPYVPPFVRCDSALIQWVAENLAANYDKPAVIFSHYNMWERNWDCRFDTTHHYQEYEGMSELRAALEQAGNVRAVVNGHVHANRVEVHNGIYYVDIGVTVVGKPSIRYFYVYPDRVVSTHAYISNSYLFGRVSGMCPYCWACFDTAAVCDFIDGAEADKVFEIPLEATTGLAVGDPESPPSESGDPDLDLDIRYGASGQIEAVISSGRAGTVAISLYGLSGRRLDRASVAVSSSEAVADLWTEFEAMSDLAPGIYFVRATAAGAAKTRKMLLAP